MPLEEKPETRVDFEIGDRVQFNYDGGIFDAIVRPPSSLAIRLRSSGNYALEILSVRRETTTVSITRGLIEGAVLEVHPQFISPEPPLISLARAAQ